MKIDDLRIPSHYLIDGLQGAAISGEKISVLDPCTGKEITTVPRGDWRDVDNAVQAARRARAGHWGKITATERGRILQKIGMLILDHRDELMHLEALDTGKPLAVAQADASASARYFEYYGGAADKIMGHTIPYLNDYHVSVVRVPHGITAHIIPWNYPAQIMGRSVAPALAMGNAVIVKPSELACLTVLRIAELALEAGLPPGALNIVTGYGEEAGAPLSAHAGVNFVTFTGSRRTGRQIQIAAAEHNVRCVLELGGKSPHIVFDDADLTLAVPQIVKGIIQNSGQTCSAGSRVLIHRDIFDEVVDRVAAQFRDIRVGSSDMNADCGPLISRNQLNMVRDRIEEARNTGARIVAEGAFCDGLDPEGFFVKPVLFDTVDPSSYLAQHEIFGPVLAAMPFSTEEEAVKIANGTEYGLVSAVWTKDATRALRIGKQMDSGQVFMNCFGAGGGVELPFGGVKGSGYGREKGFGALEEMSVTKTMIQFCGQ